MIIDHNTGKILSTISIGGKNVVSIQDHTTGKYLYWTPASPVADFTGVRLMRYNGEIISLAHWQADDIPVREAVGVAIGDGTSATGHRFCLFKTFMKNSSAKPCQFTATNTIVIPNMVTETAYANAIADFAGKANTQAVLDALANHTITNANVAEYCHGIWSPWGDRGYIPSAGQMKMMFDLATDINTCMTYIGGDSFVTANTEFYWTSTQYNANAVWGKVASVNNQLNKGASSNAYKGLAVFDY